VLRDITIKMPKEVPGTISQTFRDIFPFSFAEAVITLLQPLFTAADGYLGIAIIWGC